MPKKKAKGGKNAEAEAAAAAEAERKAAEAAAAVAAAEEQARLEAEEEARKEAEEQARRERPFRLTVQTRCAPFNRTPTTGVKRIALTVRQVDKISAVKQQLVAMCRPSQKITVGRIVLSYARARGESETWRDLENDSTLFDYGVAPGGDGSGGGGDGGGDGGATLLTLKLRTLTEADLVPMGPASTDPWLYSAEDRTLIRTACHDSVFDELRYEEEMKRWSALQRQPGAGALGHDDIGEDAEDDFSGSGSASEEDSEDEMPPPPELPSTNHGLLGLLTTRTGALRQRQEESEGAAYDPVASLRGAIAFQKTRKKTEKLLR